MGKIKKIKEQRKREREVSEQRRSKKKSRIFRSVFLLILLGGLAYGGIFGYNKYLKDYIAKIKNNKNEQNEETLRQAQGKEEKKEVSSKNIGDKKYSAAPDMQIDVNKEYTADIKTNKGEFKVKFFTKDAPKTVNNFVVLARDKFFDGLIFHRIIKDFMIQGGDPLGTGTGDPGYKFEDEFNDHKLVRGTLAMANSGPGTNGSQFFIVTKESTDWLDGKHTAFGEVIEGIEKVMEMEKVEVGENDKPIEDVRIESVIINEK